MDTCRAKAAFRKLRDMLLPIELVACFPIFLLPYMQSPRLSRERGLSESAIVIELAARHLDVAMMISVITIALEARVVQSPRRHLPPPTPRRPT